MSTARGYLKDARKRHNLRIESDALTTRILFEGRRAVGVEYRKDGATHTARANGEVILSGGAFNSPQLLQLSGVGPADLLQAARHRRDRRHARRRRGPAGSFPGAHGLSLHRAHHDERHREFAAAEDRGGHPLHAVPQRHAHHRRGIRGRVPQDRRPTPRRRTCNSTSSSSRPTRSAATCIRSPASSCRCASCVPRAAAPCASSPPIRRRRPRSSPAT